MGAIPEDAEAGGIAAFGLSREEVGGGLEFEGELVGQAGEGAGGAGGVIGFPPGEEASGSGYGSGERHDSQVTDPASTHFLAENFFGLDAGYWIIIALSLSLSSVAIYFWNLSDKAEANLRASERELEEVKRAFKKATIAQSNAASTLTRGGVASAPAPAPAPQFKTPVEVERAVARLTRRGSGATCGARRRGRDPPPPTGCLL
jgi:hypothetical protein